MDGLDTRDDLSEEREPIDDLEEIPLNDGNKEHTVQIGSNLKGEVRKQLVTFLQRNADVFVWMPADMPGINAEVIEHYLGVDLRRRSMKQKKRSFAPEAEGDNG
ncbi:hypothetical protein COCNU_scaffold000892G000030 [Cocos nucifera]|nr:hypothetical protein [Cocos nucifera]